MPTLININVNQKGSDNAVPILRQNKFIALLKAFLAPLTKLQSDIADNYLGGLVYSAWSNVTTYSYGDRVTLDMLAGNASYEYINATPSSGHYVTDAAYWYKITSDNIGLTERLNYNAQKMQLEYILNRRFSPLTVSPPFDAAHSSIYITNNQSYSRIAWKGSSNARSSYRKTKAATNFYYHPSGNPSLSATNFTIHVPVAILSAISPYGIADAKLMMAKETMKYNNAGITFNIQQY